MAYSSGTVTPGTTYGLQMADIAKAAIDAHANWSFEETVVGATQTYHVMKCAAAGNSAGIDFRVFVGYVTATPTAFFMRIAEGWDAGANTCSNAGFYNTSENLQADNTLNDTFDVENATFWGRYSSSTVTGTPRYEICTNANRVIWYSTLGTTTNALCYAGLYEIGPGLTEVTAPMPCVLTGYGVWTPAVGSSGGLAGGAMTRHPTRTAGSLQNGRAMFARQLPVSAGDGADESQNNLVPMAPHVWPMGGVGWGADAFDSRLEAGKAMIITQTPSVGGLLGYPEGLVITRCLWTTVPGPGDTITIGGVTHVYVGPTQGGDHDASSTHSYRAWASTGD